jgi:glyoxylase-like metal-dependent hydrolase (beta-lactamase superfamily II)
MLRIERVLAPNPDVFTLEGTNTWIVGRDPSVVIDPGPEIASHLDEVARTAGAVGAVLVSHDHPDHAPGAAGFAERVGAPLYAYRLPGAERLRDGATVSAGDVDVVAVHTPGHATDHVAFHVPSEDALFTGDAVLGRGTSFIGPPDGDLERYLASLRRMLELGPRTIYPGHGPIVLRAQDKLHEYLEHRAERERQILDGLADGPRTIVQLVERIYAEYPAEVHVLAGRSVLAHLLKLENEGRVVHEGRGGDAAWLIVAKPKSCARCGRPVRGRARYCASCSVILLQEGADRQPPAEA